MYVFFFKQKTAYEMRISDWSSDVCSSDLQADDGDGVELHAQENEFRVLHGARRREDRVELHRAEHHEDAEDAERETEVADAINDEGLDRRRIRCGAVVPEADRKSTRLNSSH